MRLDEARRRREAVVVEREDDLGAGRPARQKPNERIALSCREMIDGSGSAASMSSHAWHSSRSAAASRSSAGIVSRPSARPG